MIEFIETIAIKPKLESEMSLIGAVLIEPDEVLPELEHLLEEDDFLDLQCRTAYRTCAGYFVDGKPIDPLTLLEQLGQEYKVFLYSCVDLMPSIANWRAYAQIVRENGLRYRAMKKAQELIVQLADGEELSDCQATSIQACEAFNLAKKDKTVSAAEGLRNAIAGLKKAREYIQTGFAALDSFARIERGDYIILGGRPSAAKTAFALELLTKMSKRHKVAFFSLETSEAKVFDRLFANFFDIPLYRIKDNEHTEIEYHELRKVFENMSFSVVEAAGWSVAQIQAKAVQLGADVIFIDYLGLIKSKGASRYEQITNVSIDLHTMAQSRKIVTVALCQLNREGVGEPDMTHLRESGQIEQDADLILLLHNLGERERFDRKLIIAKNKEGRTGALRFSFDGERQRFLEVDVRYEH